MNLDKYESIRTHQVALYVNGNNMIYFDNFGVEHVSKKIKEIIGNKTITNKKGKSLLEYTNLFFPNDYEKNDTIKLKYFQ